MEGHQASSGLRSQRSEHRPSGGSLGKFLGQNGLLWCSLATEAVWSKASKTKWNRPGGGGKRGPEEGNSMHKMWTLQGPGAGGAWKRSRGRE